MAIEDYDEVQISSGAHRMLIFKAAMLIWWQFVIEIENCDWLWL